MLDIHDGACEPDIVMKKFIDFIKNKDPTRSSDFVLTISYYHHHCHGIIIVIKMAIMPWSLPHSICSGSDQPLESLVLHALTQWNQSLEFRNTSRLLSLATGIRSIEASITHSFPNNGPRLKSAPRPPPSAQAESANFRSFYVKQADFSPPPPAT